MKISVTLTATLEIDVAAFAADYDYEMDEDPMDDEKFDIPHLINIAEKTFTLDPDEFWELHDACDGKMKVTAKAKK